MIAYDMKFIEIILFDMMFMTYVLKNIFFSWYDNGQCLKHKSFFYVSLY